MSGFGRLSPANLVGSDDPVPRPGQRLNDIFTVVTTKGLSVEKYQRHNVGILFRGDVHVRHLQRLKVTGYGKKLNRIGVLVSWVCQSVSLSDGPSGKSSPARSVYLLMRS